MFGDYHWFSRLYQRIEHNSLFDDELVTKFSKTTDPFGVITDYFVNRLRTVFAEVAPNPLVMRNSSNSPIFLLCFAAGNPNGAPIAVRIAQHILGKS